MRILRLTAQGKTNREIGQELFLSPNTVKRLIRNLYDKLDVTTRSAATRFAFLHQLI